MTVTGRDRDWQSRTSSSSLSSTVPVASTSSHDVGTLTSGIPVIDSDLAVGYDTVLAVTELARNLKAACRPGSGFRASHGGWQA